MFSTTDLMICTEANICRLLNTSDTNTALQLIIKKDWASFHFFEFFREVCKLSTSKLKLLDLVKLLAQTQRSTFEINKCVSHVLTDVFYNTKTGESISVEECRDVLYSVIDFLGLDATIARLYEAYGVYTDSNLMQVFAILTDDQQVKLIAPLISIWLLKYNANMLFYFNQSYQDLFASVIGKLPADLQMRVNDLITIRHPKKRNDFTLAMTAFYSPIEIDYDMGLSVLALIKSRKQFNFDPVLIKNELQFRDFLDNLHDAPKPTTARFILCGHHWVCGEVSVDEQFHLNCLILDSLGASKSAFADDANPPWLETNTGKFILTTLEYFPQTTIYLPMHQQQHDHISCKIFALDNLLRLYTVNSFLNPQFKESGLWGYLAVSGNTEHWFTLPDTQATVHGFHLPLPLLRNMQSRDLFDIIRARDEGEQKQPVNKKGATPQTSALKFFVGDKNIRLRYKFGRLAQLVADYLIKTDSEDARSAKMQFMVDNWRKRLTQQTPASTPLSPTRGLKQ